MCSLVSSQLSLLDLCCIKMSRLAELLSRPMELGACGANSSAMCAAPCHKRPRADTIARSASRATTKMKVGSATKGTKRKVDCAPKRKAGSIAKSKAGLTATRKSGLSGSLCSVKRARTGQALAAKCSVFTMMETDEQHALRHPKLDVACLRCAFARYGRDWQRLAGQESFDSSGSRCWLSPRPAYMGGTLGFGLHGMCSKTAREIE